MSSALPLLFPPQTLSDRRRHSVASEPCSPPSHLSLADQDFLALEEPQTDYRTPTIRTRLSQLCREGQPHIARQVFDTLPRPTTVLWNTIIIGLICNNMPKEAILFYSRMRSSSTKCDSYTYSSSLKACADTRQLKIGKAVHCHVLRSQIHASRIVYNSLLNMYSTCLASSVNSEFFQVDLVHRVFHTMKNRNVVAWNIMISWYVKTERFRLAVVQFMRMMKMGIEPTAVSFVNVFPAISGLHALKVAGVLYGLLIKFGSDFFRDLFVVSSAISMYSEMGYTEWARKIFEGCLEKNPEVWNTMIGGYAQNYQYIEALELLIDALKSEHTSLDDLTFVAALNAVSQLQQLHIGKQVHAYIIKTPMDFSVTLMNAVVVMYSRCSSIVESFNVFREMPERDNVSWNTMITALVHNGLDEEALMLVNEMQKEGFVIDSVTATALLSASSNRRSLSIGKQTHAYLIRHGIQFDGMHSYIIDMYAKCGSIEKAQWLFDDMNDHHRDQATWNAMISGNVQNGLIDKAFVVFGLMIERNVMPNAVTIASILPACSIGGIAFGKQLHGFAIRHSIDCSVFVGTALVDMYSKSGTVAYAENVFSTMIVKNSVTYTNMILGYASTWNGSSSSLLVPFNEVFWCKTRCHYLCCSLICLQLHRFG
ncbi:hypothetical protein Nepgr_028985 [Nepenthes gracilis]|uniref:Pentatricopeptide repeat-containing protein n=1 Tax=Nepenthes gracilis TaxID=150966 RepID=A0AAD3TD43_NEPGR|nr:hypothetical protein Nepgr_028985 [Nepenthes gracilis]